MKTSKNKIITCALGAFSVFLLAGNTLSAHDTTKHADDLPLRVLELGARFMPTISQFDMRNSDDVSIAGEANLGYGVGGVLGVNFTKNIGVQVEVIYNTLSQRFKDKQLERTITVNYVNVPVLLAINTDKRRAVNLNLVVGPQVGVNVGSNFKTTGSTESDTLTAVLAVKQGDLGFAYGAGLDFCLNEAHTVNLSVGFRGVLGLVDVSDDSQTITNQSYFLLDRTNIRTYSAYIGISFLF